MTEQGHHADHRSCDIANAADVQAIIETNLERYSRIDASLLGRGADPRETAQATPD